jgi:hypothetical protein
MKSEKHVINLHIGQLVGRVDLSSHSHKYCENLMLQVKDNLTEVFLLALNSALQQIDSIDTNRNEPINQIMIFKKDAFLQLASDEKGKKKLKPLKNAIEVKGYVICSEHPLHSDNREANRRAERILWNSLVLKSRRK